MNISATSAMTATETGRTPTQTLGQKEFLSLLSTQMTQQDPLNPMKDTDFIAQLAQFTSLEQAKNSSQSMSMIQATSMIGKEVTLKGETANSEIQGRVTGVVMDGDKPMLTIAGDPESYALSRVTSISQAPELVAAPTGYTPVATAPADHVPAPASWMPPKLAALLNP